MVTVWVVLAPTSAVAANWRELSSQGKVAYLSKKYAECARLKEKAAAGVKDPHERQGEFYEAACCRALNGEKEKAFANLEASIRLGFWMTSQLKKEPDLASLRSEPRWKKVIESAEAAEAKFRASVNQDLYEILLAAQADRKGGVSPEVKKRDEERRARVQKMIDAGQVKVAMDYIHASLIFQQGGTSQTYEQAHKLAMKAVEVDPKFSRARWLAAATKDRWLHSLGKPQLYGTQIRSLDGRWTLEPVDPSITDEERERWNVPPLKLTRAQVEQMNVIEGAQMLPVGNLTLTNEVSGGRDGGTK